MTLKTAPSPKESRGGRRSASRFRSFFRRAVVVGAIAYPVVLFLVVLAFRFIGESWWGTTVGSYAPGFVYALPLPVFVAALFLLRERRLFWTQAVAAFLVLVPLMGFVLPWPASRDGGRPALRVMSFNADSGYYGWPRVAQEIEKLNPDVLLMQEAPWPEELMKLLLPRYPHQQHSTQFVLASRYPILETTDPPRLPYYGRQRSPRFLRHVLQTPLGKLTFYNVHPISPRGMLNIHRVRDAFHQIRTGKAFAGDAEEDVMGNAGLRSLQIESAGRMARAESNPVVIAGDLNLPSPSRTLRVNLGGFRDAFRDASSGFGYTFPARHRFLRLDRILFAEPLRAVDFQIACSDISDHQCVVADLQRRGDP